MKKTAEEILKAEFVDGEWEELMSYMNTDITPSIVRAMEKHADQFKPKWVEISDQEIKRAAEQAFMKRYSGFINEQIDLDRGRRRDIESFKKGAKFVVDSFILPSAPERKEVGE